MQSLLYTELHVNGATKLKLYSYIGIGIGKYLGEWGVSKFLRYGASMGAGPLNANLGPPYYLRNYWS